MRDLLKWFPSPEFRGGQKFVVDTNIIVSAILLGGTPEMILLKTITEHDLILSDFIITEVVTVLKRVRPKLSQKFIKELKGKLSQYAFDDTVSGKVVVRDKKDVNIIKLAIRQGAVIVTGDKDLLEYRGKVVVISADEFAMLFI